MNVRPGFKKIGGEISSPSSIQSSRIEDNVKREQPSFETRQDDSHLNMVTREEAQNMATRAAETAIERTLAKKNSENDSDSGSFMGLDPKLQKQLEGTVTLFNTLKEFSSNPLQKAIETKVGELAAGVVENAFGKPQQKQPRGMIAEFLSPILDSQFGAHLGDGLGQRGPEMVEAMGRTFGKEKTANMIDGILGSGKTKQLGIPGAPPLGATSGQTKPQTEKELLLTLSPDNPEHVAAYADSQGGLPPDIARKMLMMHQDAFIKQIGIQGIQKQGQEHEIDGQMPGQMPGQTFEQSGQQQIMETLQQFSGDMNKALGNTNTIIGELYKKIEGLENDINILKSKGGKDLGIKDLDIKEIIKEEKKKEEDKKEVIDDKVNDVTEKWTDEEAQEAEFRMRT